MNDTSKVVSVVIGVIVTIFLLLVLADCTVVRQRKIVEVELVTVRTGTIKDEGGLPRYAYKVEYSTGQLCVGDKVRVLRTRGGIFGWFPQWYLIERVEDQ